MSKATTLQWWNVTSPEFSYVEVVCDDGTGPLEYDRDWICVEAHTASEAKAIAVKHWLQDQKSYASNSRQSGENPYAGIEVEPIIPTENPFYIRYSEGI